MIALGLLRSIRVGWAEHAASALLQDEDTPSPAVRVIAAVYWPLAAAIYLTRSFGIGDWQIRWITWPIAGALYVALWGMNMAPAGARSVALGGMSGPRRGGRAEPAPRAAAAEPHLRARQGGAFASVLRRLLGEKPHGAPPALRLHSHIRLLT